MTLNILKPWTSTRPGKPQPTLQLTEQDLFYLDGHATKRRGHAEIRWKGDRLCTR